MTKGVYIVSLGGVGANITRIMYDTDIRPLPSILEKLGIRYIDEPYRLMPNSETQIIDMAYEKESHEYLKNKYKLLEGDHIKILTLNSEEYKPQTIFRKTQNIGYNNLQRYWILSSDIIDSLGPRQGVKRYRPLARYFTSLIARDIRATIRDDYEHDFNNQPTVNIFITSAGGGFGSGSLLTIASIAKYEANQQSRNVLVLHLPVGSRYRLPLEDTPFGEENAYASMGMTLLELMYLHELKLNNKRYIDKLTKFISRELGLREDTSFYLQPFDMIILSGMRNLGSYAGIEDEFQAHDENLATIIMSIIAGFRSGEKEPISILEDNQTVSRYNSHIRIAIRSKGIPLSLLYPLEIYGIKYIKLNKEEVREISQQLKDILSKKDKIQDKISMLQERLNSIDSEIEKMQQEKRALEQEKIKIDTIDTVRKLDKLLDITDGGELRSNIKTMLRYVGNIKDEYNKFVQNMKQVNGMLGIISGMILVSKQKLKDAINTMNMILSQIGGIEQSITTIRSSVSEIYARLPPRIRDKKEKDIIIVLTYKVILSKILDYIDEIVTKQSNIENYINELETSASRYKGIIICGAACDLIKKLHDLKSRIAGNNKSELMRYREMISDIKAYLDETSRSYRNMLQNQINELDMNIQDKLKERDSIKSELNNANEELANINNELSKAVMMFVANYVDLYKKLGVHIDGDSMLVSDIVNDPTRLDMLKKMLIDENLRKTFESIDASIGAFSQISNIAGEQLRSSIQNALKEGIDSSITLSLDSGDDIRKGFDIDNSDIASIIDQRQYYVVYTSDNRELAKNLVDKLGEYAGGQRTINSVEVVSDRSSFIGVIVKRINIPMIAVKEVREVIKHALTKKPTTVVECGEHHDRFITRDEVSNCMKSVEEYVGLKFATLDVISNDFLNFLDRVKETIEDYERRTGGA